jgi:hypothetical protein
MGWTRDQMEAAYDATRRRYGRSFDRITLEEFAAGSPVVRFGGMGDPTEGEIVFSVGSESTLSVREGLSETNTVATMTRGQARDLASRLLKAADDLDRTNPLPSPVDVQGGER